MKIKDQMKVYKIRDKKTGLFSCGGRTPKFSKYGKTWSSSGALKNHLHCVTEGEWDFSVKKYKQIKIPSNWEIVEYTLSLGEITSWSAQAEHERPAKK